MKWLLWLLALVSLFVIAEPRKLQLAASNYQDIDLHQYLVSEKYDGIRAYWDGSKLYSRQGNELNAPAWFAADFPKMELDGELWMGRQQFEQTASIILSKQPSSKWQQISYMVFDAPNIELPFIERYQLLKQIIEQSSNPYLKLVQQQSISNHQQLDRKLKILTEAGAEGLMLKKKSSLYHSKRNQDLIKVKLWQDAEATVIKHIAGRGKNQGLMGAIVVKTEQGLTFKIGTGFTQQQRLHPPEIGSLITYKYTGKYKSGKPKFATFMRIKRFP